MLSTPSSRPLVLASQSAIRRDMLAAAALDFAVRPADIDEEAVKQALDKPADVARTLAIAKAEAVSAIEPDALVIGSDSVVSVDGRRFSKPRSRAEAAEHLRIFSGRTIELSSAVALAAEGRADWSTVETARLSVRALSDDFIARYLDVEWPAVSYCVGVFRLEGPGVHLFDAIDGDHFTILGMPLLPLLAALRDKGVVPG